MAVASLAGLLRDGFYCDAEWAKAAWFGNDIVTLFVAVPILVIALLLARRGSRRGELLWYAMLGYAVYNYAFYLFGARMNELFLLYAVLFVLLAIAWTAHWAGWVFRGIEPAIGEEAFTLIASLGPR